MKMIYKFEKALAEIKPSLDNFPFEDSDMYTRWLEQIYFIVKHSTTLLACAAVRAIHSHPEFQKRCFDHITEEKGHEKLLLNDLKQFNKEPKVELPITCAIYSTEYYRIEHKGAMSVLGYIFFLELLAVHFGEKVMNRAGTRGITFLKLHANEDPGHIESAQAQLNNLSEADLNLVLESFMGTLNLYRIMLNEIISKQAQA